jgi:riboflavin biosynthesis pyrimidine reductase
MTGPWSSTVALAPLEPLLRVSRGNSLPLPAKLARLYGDLRMPRRALHPIVFSNFVTTLDGVVSLRIKGHAGGGDISGFNVPDRMVMGLLRAIADVVIVGSGTLEEDRKHIWTPEAICPELGPAYNELRAALRKPQCPQNVIVTGSGHVDLRLPVFKSRPVRPLVLTTAGGARRLARQRVVGPSQILAIHHGDGPIPASVILTKLCRAPGIQRILIEGGPTLLGEFFEQRLVDELFLTVAPQIAGRKLNDGRLGLVMGESFAPRTPLWSSLSDVRRSKNHLFLRYSFPRSAARSAGRVFRRHPCSDL